MNFTEKKRHILRQIDTEKRKGKYGISFDVFINAPKAIKLTEDDIGKRVWYVAEPRTAKITLTSIEEEHVEIKYRGGFVRAVLPDEVLLHPSEWNKKRLKNV